MTSVDYLNNPAKIASYLGAFGSLALTTLDTHRYNQDIDGHGEDP
jgi:hypothetical protein